MTNASSSVRRAAPWPQVALITAVAIAAYVTLRLLPTGTNLSHGDFAVQGKNSIEMCDPLNPQFVPVVAAKSPVTLAVTTLALPRAGQPVSAKLTLTTWSGHAITPVDLLVVHEHPLHLMIADPSLTDYQHVHPQPTGKPGEWAFSFTPRFGGTYRLFADFTPVATGRSLYANSDVAVTGSEASEWPASAAHLEAAPASVVRHGYHFSLVPAHVPFRVREPIDFILRVTADADQPVPLQPIMGAYAHLVAFDAKRTGFAHLHPQQADPLQPPDRVHPALAFKLTIPTAGRYVIWAQVNLGGHEAFAPFWFDVQ